MAAERRYDVVVAGGGPAGLSAARVIAAEGLRVLVVEKHGEIGSPTRTSGGSFIADMVALGVPRHLYNPVRVCRLLGPASKATFSYAEAPACVVNVRALYQHLAEQAIAAGARLQLRAQVTGITRSPGGVAGVTVRDHSGQTRDIACALVVDATGFSSTVAVKAGIHEHYRRAGVGAEYDLFAPNYPQEMAVLAMGSALAPAGYAWALPYGHHRVRAGVGIIRPDSAADPIDYLDAFVRNYAPLKEAFAGSSPVEFHTGVIPSVGLNERLVADGVITAGDAAGQASTLVGEGIRFAMYGGNMAGRVAAGAVQNGDVSAAALEPYEREWRHRFGRNLRLSYAANKRIARYSDAQWDGAVTALHDLRPADFAAFLASDFSLGLGVRVITRRPRLLRTVVRIARGRPQNA